MAVGFDPYDVFAEYEVTSTEEDTKDLFNHGLKLSDVILDEEQAEQMYHSQFKPSWEREATECS